MSEMLCLYCGSQIEEPDPVENPKTLSGGMQYLLDCNKRLRNIIRQHGEGCVFKVTLQEKLTDGEKSVDAERQLWAEGFYDRV